MTNIVDNSFEKKITACTPVDRPTLTAGLRVRLRSYFACTGLLKVAYMRILIHKSHVLVMILLVVLTVVENMTKYRGVYRHRCIFSDDTIRYTTQGVVLSWQVICPSVCLSVTLRYCGYMYIFWISTKTIATYSIVRLGYSLSTAPNIINQVRWEHLQIHVI